MKTRRLRLVRPRWTLGTMLLIVGWSAVVVWLNSKPRRDDRLRYINGQGRYFHGIKYGCPWTFAGSPHLYDPADAIPRYRPELTYRSWPLAGNIAIGLLAVAVLTFASKYLLRAIVAGLRAFVGKPPPSNAEGHQGPS